MATVTPCRNYSRWRELDHSVYHPLDVEALPDAEWLKELQARSVEFLGAVTQWARDDYREAAELTTLALGHRPPRGVHFLRPGACHHARWMAKVCSFIQLFEVSLH